MDWQCWLNCHHWRCWSCELSMTAMMISQSAWWPVCFNVQHILSDLYTVLLCFVLLWFKAKPHGCCIFSMILHEAPSMETMTPKGEWFPCWVAEWSIMENMQQQMWFCFYPSPISINISIYVYNALRSTPKIWFWAMPFASFRIDINKYLLLSLRLARWYLIVTSCRHGSRDKTLVWWFLASLFFPENTCYKQRYAISNPTGYYKKHINGTHHSLSAPKTNLESPDMAWMPWTRALPSYSYANEGVVSNMQIRARGIHSFGYHGPNPLVFTPRRGINISYLWFISLIQPYNFRIPLLALGQ